MEIKDLTWRELSKVLLNAASRRFECSPQIHARPVFTGPFTTYGWYGSWVSTVVEWRASTLVGHVLSGWSLSFSLTHWIWGWGVAIVVPNLLRKVVELARASDRCLRINIRALTFSGRGFICHEPKGDCQCGVPGLMSSFSIDLIVIELRFVTILTLLYGNWSGSRVPRFGKDDPGAVK